MFLFASPIPCLSVQGADHFSPWHLSRRENASEAGPRMSFQGDVLDLLYDVVRKPPSAEKAAATHCLVAAALIKLVTRCPSEAEKIKRLGLHLGGSPLVT